MIDDAEIEKEIHFVLEKAEDVQAGIACIRRLLTAHRLRWARMLQAAAREKYQACARLAHQPGKLKEIAAIQGDAGGLRLAATMIEKEGGE